MIANDNNSKSKWNLGKIIDVIKGRDGIIRRYKIWNNKGCIIERLLQLIRDLKLRLQQRNQRSSKQNRRTPYERTTYERKAKMEARNRIIGVNLEHDNKIWRVSHKETILKLIFTLIVWICMNSSRRVEMVNTNCLVEELLFEGKLADYSE